MDETKASHTKRKIIKVRRRNIRRLAQPAEPPTPSTFKKFVKLICIPILISCLMIFVYKNRQIFHELRQLSMNQYQLYLHGRLNYCDESFQYRNITNALSRIIGQEVAINRIEQSLRSHDRFTAMALFGTQGVGKTLALKLIQQHFQWHLNIQQYVWSAIHSKQSQLKSLLKLIGKLTACGQNGIFIDNIPLSCIEIIEEFHHKLQQTCEAKRLGALVVYVFNVDDIDHKRELRISNVSSIHFRNLNRTDLMKCIEVESKRLGVKLTNEQLDELIAGIDLERNGCKTVAAKVALYTRKESGDL